MTTPKQKVQAPTPAAAPAQQGADEFRIGAVDQNARGKTAIGRLALRIGGMRRPAGK